MDIIFADPPFNIENIEEIPKIILNNWNSKNNGLLIFEHGRDVNFQESTNFIEIRTYNYYKTFFLKKTSEK